MLVFCPPVLENAFVSPADFLERHFCVAASKKTGWDRAVRRLSTLLGCVALSENRARVSRTAALSKNFLADAFRRYRVRVSRAAALSAFL